MQDGWENCDRGIQNGNFIEFRWPINTIGLGFVARTVALDNHILMPNGFQVSVLVLLRQAGPL